MKSPYDIIRRPIITEKSIKLVEMGKYTFEVAQGVNRVEVKKAIAEIFSVDVVKVNLINGIAKRRRVGKNEGLKPKVKKAIVSIKAGQTIDVFEI
jgi:large subunit ribosomal protein L23